MKRFYFIGFLVLMAFDTLAQISFKLAGEAALPLEFSPAWLLRVFGQPWIYGAFVGYGVDYTKLGTITADMVVQVLVDGKDPATLPVTTFDNGIAMINTESCAALGYDLTAVKQAFDGKCSSVLETTTQQNFD